MPTGDRNYYDRYYFNCHGSAPELFLVMGLGHYPNRNVADAFAVVRRGDEQIAVRASRERGGDHSPNVGPFHIEELESARRLRVVLEPNRGERSDGESNAVFGLAFDLTFTAAVQVVAEPRHQLRTPSGRLVVDSTRVAQTGDWAGTLVVDGVEHAVTPDRWQGNRDQSRGIRPVGEPEPDPDPLPPGSFYWVYAPLRFADFSVVVIAQEDADGNRSLEEAVRVFPLDSGREPESWGRPDIALDFVPGTREVATATLTFERGPKIEVETILPLALGAGAGYGVDDWRHGMNLGPLVVQGRRYDVGDAAKRGAYFSVIDNLARATCEGQTGWGLFEFACFGPHRPSGFTDWGT